MSNFWHGLTSLGAGQSIGYIFLGSILGMVFGAVPGISTAVLLSILLVFVPHVSLVGTLCLFLGAQSGSFFSASITSILLNTPAHPEAFAVTFDGFPMARRGEPGRALGISATSTCIGGLVGCAVLVAFVPLLNVIPTLLHPPEYVALTLLAILLVGTLGTDSVAKAVVSTGIGLAISTIGASTITGELRYTYGSLGLYSGVSLVAIALGFFAIPQMAMVFGTGSIFAKQDLTGRDMEGSEGVELSRGLGRQVIGGLIETYRHWRLLLQSGLIGSLSGIVPGIGGFAANFMSYGIAKQTSRKRDQFGTGIPEGIIAPEGSSLSKEAGQMIPLIGVGIPGGIAGALFIAALASKGVHTGYGFESAYPTLPYQIAWIIAITGVVGTFAGLLLAPQLSKITKVPGPLLVPFILAFAILGPFIADISYFAVTEVIVFGCVGMALRRLRYSLASCVLGIVLGPTLETNIYLTHKVYPGASFLSARPAADVMLAITVGFLALKVRENRVARRDQRSDLVAAAGGPSETASADVVLAGTDRQYPYPLLALVTATLLAASGVYFTVYALTRLNFQNSVLPAAAGMLIAAPFLFLYPREVLGFVRHRRAQISARRASASADEPDDGAPPRVPAAPEIEATADARAVERAVADGPLQTLTRTATIETAAIAPRTMPAIAEKSWGWCGQYSRELAVFVWLGALTIACYVFGFDWGIPAFMIAYGLTGTRRTFRTWNSRAVFSVLSAAAMWGVVHELFNLTHLFFTPQIHL